MSNNLTQHFREMFRFGYNPTAARAVHLLLRIDTQQGPSVASEYRLCPFTTEHVLSFCVDTTRVVVVDVSEDLDVSSSTAATCLVVDNHSRANTPITTTAWSPTTPPRHFIFAPIMCYDRALDWMRQWETNGEMVAGGVSIDMHDTYADSDKLDNLITPVQSLNVVELTLPSTAPATCLAESFLCGCTRLTYLNMLSLTNVREIGHGFLDGCSALGSVDLSPVTGICEITSCFLYGCSVLTSADLSSLTSVTLIGDSFLRGCSLLGSVDLSAFTAVTMLRGYFLRGCAALPFVDLSPLRNVKGIGSCFLD
eukprot:PhM_4_TR10092/c3_g1_i4/m.19699